MNGRNKVPVINTWELLECAWNLLHQGVGQRLDILPVQVGGGLIQGQNATVQAEGLSEGQSDDERRQYLWAQTTHPLATIPHPWPRAGHDL